MDDVDIDDETSSIPRFTIGQRMWLVEREIGDIRAEIINLKSVLNRILWAIISLTLTMLGGIAVALFTRGG